MVRRVVPLAFLFGMALTVAMAWTGPAIAQEVKKGTAPAPAPKQEAPKTDAAKKDEAKGKPAKKEEAAKKEPEKVQGAALVENCNIRRPFRHRTGVDRRQFRCLIGNNAGARHDGPDGCDHAPIKQKSHQRAVFLA